jgi:hypothetical protein
VHHIFASILRVVTFSLCQNVLTFGQYSLVSQFLMFPLSAFDGSLTWKCSCLYLDAVLIYSFATFPPPRPLANTTTHGPWCFSATFCKIPLSTWDLCQPSQALQVFSGLSGWILISGIYPSSLVCLRFHLAIRESSPSWQLVSPMINTWSSVMTSYFSVGRPCYMPRFAFLILCFCCRCDVSLKVYILLKHWMSPGPIHRPRITPNCTV